MYLRPEQKSKTSLIAWIRDILNIQVTNIQQLGSGLVFCLLLHSQCPGIIPINKLKHNPKSEEDYLYNLKHLTTAISKLEIKNNFNSYSIAKKKYKDNYELLLWFRQNLAIIKSNFKKTQSQTKTISQNQTNFRQKPKYQSMRCQPKAQYDSNSLSTQEQKLQKIYDIYKNNKIGASQRLMQIRQLLHQTSRNENKNRKNKSLRVPLNLPFSSTQEAPSSKPISQQEQINPFSKKIDSRSVINVFTEVQKKNANYTSSFKNYMMDENPQKQANLIKDKPQTQIELKELSIIEDDYQNQNQLFAKVQSMEKKERRKTDYRRNSIKKISSLPLLSKSYTKMNDKINGIPIDKQLENKFPITSHAGLKPFIPFRRGGKVIKAPENNELDETHYLPKKGEYQENTTNRKEL